MSNRPRCRVFFRWTPEFEVRPDEEVRVTGGSDELGSWQPSMGTVLRPDPIETRCFTSRGVLLPISRSVEYKYVVCNRASDDSRWESREDNRSVLPSGQRQIVEDDGGQFRHIPFGKPAAKFKSPSAGDNASEMLAQGSESGMPRLQSFEEKIRKGQEQQVGPEDTIFAVFRTLPVRLEKSASGKWIVESDRESEAINFKVVSMMARSVPKELTNTLRFVGHPGVFTNDPDDQRKITEALVPYNCIPVFLDEQVMNRTLEFCHRFLWPVMHNMKVFDDTTQRIDSENAHQKFDEVQWRTYQVFNRTYAEVVEAVMLPETKPLIWIHDFYLLLAPRALKLRMPSASIGLFLHSAFPSSEVFRCIPPREEILQSMLACKVVTFQIFEYARHFLSCCQFLLNATYYFQGAGVLTIDHESEAVIVRADHFVIPYLDFIERVNSNEKISRQAKAIHKEFGDKLIFASIDGDEPFSGMVHKLRAFDRFLNECPQHQHRVALFQHILARRVADGQKESEMVTEIKRMADKMNKEYGRPGQPAVIVRMGELSVDDRLSILQAADVLFDTSINDGLNLHPFLFCIAHSKDKTGTMIVSEFCGCSSILTGAKKVNPWNYNTTLEALHTVVTQDEDERKRMLTTDLTYVSTQRLSSWVMANLSELKQAASAKAFPVKGLGAGCKVLSMERGFRALPMEAVLHHYKEARSRVILLDNEGTLAPDRRSVVRPYGAQDTLDRSGQAPDPSVLECLQALADDRSNTVMVLSGRPKSIMEEWFGSVKDLGMCAEHGFTWVPAGRGRSDGKADRWRCMRESGNEDDDWKSVATMMMQQYVKRVQGSVLESKGSAITWNYRKVGAQMLANEMALELARFLDPRQGPESLMYGYPVVVVNGKGYVEVKRSDVDKGITADRILAEVRERLGQVDFVLCIGDDRSDEDMFEVVNEVAKREGFETVMEDSALEMSPKTAHSAAHSGSMWGSSNPALRMNRKGSLTLEELNPADMADNSRYYTVTVGRKPSKAGYFLKDVQQVSDLLQKLAIQARARGLSRFSSMPMLVRPEDEESD